MSEAKVEHPETPAAKRRREQQAEASKTEQSTERGILSPVQHEDDGWGTTPVQMRG